MLGGLLTGCNGTITLPWLKDKGTPVEPQPIPSSDLNNTAEPMPTPSDPLLQQIELPARFAIDYFAEDVPGARSLTQTESGLVLVGSRGEGRVYALPDTNGDAVADSVVVVDEGLNSPNGVAINQGDLYVAEIGRILVYENIDATYNDKPEPQIVTDQYPNDTHHGWKFIAFGPDGKLYVPVGAPCNICKPGDPYAAITRINPDGSGFEVYARGIRNTVGFDWHPETNVLWFTDNGRDWLGDNLPPDELNRVTDPGMHFGYPYCHGEDRLDPEFGQTGDCQRYQAPALELGPHVAALGMRFARGTDFPETYQNKIFIAEHGSWNRSEKIGYRITMATVEGNTAQDYQVFAEGWLQGEEAWGRPVDLLFIGDHSLLVSDDAKGAVYRIYAQDVPD